MKYKYLKIASPLTALVMLALSGDRLAGQEIGASATIQASVSAPPDLSPGVPQILQLAQSRVAESTIIAYVQNSPQAYQLTADQIIYLKQQGVSKAVLDEMLGHRPPATLAAPSGNVSAYPQSTVVTAPSTVYVREPVYYDYPYYSRPYGYYGSSYYYPWPAVSLSFGFGGRYGHGWNGGHGGWHGGHGGHGGHHR